MKKFSFGLVWQSLKQSFKGFSDDKITKLSASLAYYTIFSIGPLLFVIIFVASIVLGKEAVEGSLYTQIDEFVGHEAAVQIQNILKNVSLSGKGGLAMVIGIVTLLLGATTVFAELQDSMNSIWGLKPKPTSGIMQTIKHRLLSFGLIGSLGFLLLVSLAATAVVSGLGAKIKEMVPGIGVVVMYIINMVLTLGLTSVLFAIIFKVLPDAAIKWKHVWPGAIFTSILFVIGKFAISMYISKSDVGTTFGAAGSLVILLLWVYYSSIIIYFGAEFAMYYALNSGYKIEPENFAEWTDKPAIAGAEATSFKSKQQSPERTPKKERERSKEPHWSFATGTPQEQKEREKKSGPGVGSMLAGLALYMIKGGNKGG